MTNILKLKKNFKYMKQNGNQYSLQFVCIQNKIRIKIKENGCGKL